MWNYNDDSKSALTELSAYLKVQRELITQLGES